MRVVGLLACVRIRTGVTTSSPKTADLSVENRAIILDLKNDRSLRKKSKLVKAQLFAGNEMRNPNQQLLIHPNIIHNHPLRKGCTCIRITRPLTPNSQIYNEVELFIKRIVVCTKISFVCSANYIAIN